MDKFEEKMAFLRSELDINKVAAEVGDNWEMVNTSTETSKNNIDARSMAKLRQELAAEQLLWTDSCKDMKKITEFLEKSDADLLKAKDSMASHENTFSLQEAAMNEQTKKFGDASAKQELRAEIDKRKQLMVELEKLELQLPLMRSEQQLRDAIQDEYAEVCKDEMKWSVKVDNAQLATGERNARLAKGRRK